LREAEREADLGDTRKSLESLTKLNPLADIRKDFDQTMRQATTTASPKPATAGPEIATPVSAVETASAPSISAVNREAGTDAA
jgi:hypothetical protein